jgi:hypothetical protein
MDVPCSHLKNIYDLALAEGNAVREVQEGWTNVKQLFVMKAPMGPRVRALTVSPTTGIRHWTNKGTPHNPADEGFTCDACKVAISFPSS